MKCVECGNNVAKDEFCTNCGKQAKTPRTAKTGDLRIPQKVKTEFQNNGMESKAESVSKFSNPKSLQIGLIASISLTVILFLVSISVMTGTESRIADLEDEVFFLQDRVSSLETDIANLETQISDTNDLVTGEIDSVQNCINGFIDVWAERGTYALYCR